MWKLWWRRNITKISSFTWSLSGMIAWTLLRMKRGLPIMCMPSATHDQSIVACEYVWIGLVTIFHELSLSGKQGQGGDGFPQVTLELAALGNCRLGQVLERGGGRSLCRSLEQKVELQWSFNRVHHHQSTWSMTLAVQCPVFGIYCFRWEEQLV